jgi:hypothetical protein
LNPGRRGGKPATNRLSYGAACFTELVNTQIVNGIYTLNIVSQEELYKNKKFREELIAYFPLMRHDPLRKRRN